MKFKNKKKIFFIGETIELERQIKKGKDHLLKVKNDDTQLQKLKENIKYQEYFYL